MSKGAVVHANDAQVRHTTFNYSQKAPLVAQTYQVQAASPELLLC